MNMEKQKFYIIALNMEFRGLISIVTSVMNHVIYGYQNNFISVVDLKHYNNMYFKQNKAYRDNSWEYFFKQPCYKSLKDVENNEDIDVVISKNTHNAGTVFDFNIEQIPVNIVCHDKKILKIKDYYKQFLHFSDELQTWLDEKLNLFAKSNNLESNMSSRVLGVLCRGTDYTERKTPGHPIQPNVKNLINDIKNFLKKHPHVERIYLATEDAAIYNKFKKEFGDTLLDNEQYMYNQNEEEKHQLLGEIKTERVNHHYNLAKEYLFSLYLLSKLDFFIAGRCNGSAFVWLLSEGFKYMYIYKLGTYPPFNKQYNLFERFFSIKKDYEKKLNVITILGIKIKFHF